MRPSQNLEIKEMVEELLNNSAGEAYEGWDGYWEDQAKTRDELLNMLDIWFEFCKIRNELE